MNDCSEASGFATLPVELQHMILSMLSVRDVLRCSLVSHGWNQVAMDAVLWRNLYSLHFAPIDDLDLLTAPGTYWREKIGEYLKAWKSLYGWSDQLNWACSSEFPSLVTNLLSYEFDNLATLDLGSAKLLGKRRLKNLLATIKGDNNNALSLVAAQGNVAIMKLLLKQNSAIPVTCWMNAIRYKHLPLFALLLSHAIKENSFPEDIFTPHRSSRRLPLLHLCAASGGEEILNYLLEHYRDHINLEQRSGANANTALLIAAKRGHLGTFLILKNLGARLDVTNAKGSNLITICARGLHRAFMAHAWARRYHYEYESAAEPSKNMPKVASPSSWKRNRLAILKMALEGLEPTIPDGKGYTGLHHACIRPFKGALKLLLTDPRVVQHIDMTSIRGETALCFAALSKLSLLRILLRAGANPSEGLMKPLEAAIAHSRDMKPSIPVISFLLESGADPNYNSCQGGGALHAALRLHKQDIRREIAILLLKFGADVNHIAPGEHDGGLYSSPVLDAAASKKLSMLKLLKKHKVPLDKVATCCGRSALCIAAKQGDEKIAIQILQHPDFDFAKHFGKKNPGQTALTKAAMAGDVKVVEWLLAQGESVNGGVDQSHVGCTAYERHDDYWGEPWCASSPLVCAAGNGHEDIVDILIQHGASLSARGNAHQANALMAALLSGHYVLAIKLLSHISDTNPAILTHKDCMNRTALDIFLNGSYNWEKKNLAVSQLLRNKLQRLVHGPKRK